ncbi:enoyl-CoA hydratase [Rhodococcus sp. NPDC049939]|uniref:enoyl-CoA hydratase n=1 Tax=Rhodococcus sp. NPDC049939 TaxID=3155511 RepID=UPI0033EAE9E3
MRPNFATTTVERDTGIAFVTLNRPERRNPLSLEAMRDVTATLRKLGGDDTVRVVVIGAAGPAFSAGHDLKEMIGRTLMEEQAIFDACVEMMQAVEGIGQPVIASVQGAALAAGCQLVASCDLVVASSNATFGTPGVKIGLFCSTPMVAVSRAIGRKRALQMLLTGQTIDADTAADWGLVNLVVPDEDLAAETRALAERITTASPLTVRIGKQAFYRQIDLPQDRAYDAMAETMATNAVNHDAQEGMQAFLEKRTPQWEGR